MGIQGGGRRELKKILVGVGTLIGLAAIFFTALPTLLQAAGLHPAYEGASVELPGKRALIITTSHSVLAAPGETEGPETGVMASEFTHPYYDHAALFNQSNLYKIQNKKNTLFCGSYFGYGFHEDGIKSTIEMLKTLND